MSLDIEVSDAPKAIAGPALTLPSIPPLENGDYLSREEFERRYMNDIIPIS